VKFHKTVKFSQNQLEDGRPENVLLSDERLRSPAAPESTKIEKSSKQSRKRDRRILGRFSAFWRVKGTSRGVEAA
jgi:hypothetical protein